MFTMPCRGRACPARACMAGTAAVGQRRAGHVPPQPGGKRQTSGVRKAAPHPPLRGTFPRRGKALRKEERTIQTYLEQAFGKSDVTSAKMRAALREWLDLYYGAPRPGDALPSIRLLARELRISVITTKRAYEDLERDGFILTQQGRGSFVAEQNPALLREEHLKKVEDCLQGAVDAARLGGIGYDEVAETLRLLWEG